MSESPVVERQVPTYTTELFAGVLRDACVVVPVINEGERIRSLLRKMRDCGIAGLADIIIVDGGSRDGSLEPEFLKAHGVSALLTKTGPGKLGSQLRCAYDFALDRGYEYIVTIDGNDKDDPQAIPDFISAMKSGVDFVQASRFVSGGHAENTPLSRWVAIRCIHAPLLAFCSGFAWTDTTQGFRGYRRQVLEDPRVAPFRDVFQEYELLAYLSYRVPRLGYRIQELPTSRVYPVGEVPTKIKAFSGNYNVFRTLIRTCLKRYDPRP